MRCVSESLPPRFALMLPCVVLVGWSTGCWPLLDPMCYRHFWEDPRSFPDYETRLAQVRADAVETECDPRLFVSTGLCEDGDTLFVSRGDGFTSRTDYFNSDGVFVALTETQDLASLPCLGRRDWPKTVECGESTVTEVICGAN